MRVRSTGPAGGISASSAVGGVTRSEASSPVASAAPVRRTGDTASIMGVPEAELTPNVQRALLTLMGEVDQLRRETEALRAKVRDLEELADRDVLLPVLNRRAFLREVSKALSLAERHDAPSALVYLDLNGFKAINDTYGHAAGDSALQMVADVLVASVRDTDAVGRLGGDEFGVVLVLTAPEQAERKAEELAAAIAATPILHEGLTLHLKAAWGVHGLTGGTSVEAAMAEADAAMYARKQAAA
ncbi:MAG: GGDEF domain-containing protein [Glycocaulis sp.]